MVTNRDTWTSKMQFVVKNYGLYGNPINLHNIRQPCYEEQYCALVEGYV
jgi:hypothetical protein